MSQAGQAPQAPQQVVFGAAPAAQAPAPASPPHGQGGENNSGAANKDQSPSAAPGPPLGVRVLVGQVAPDDAGKLMKTLF